MNPDKHGKISETTFTIPEKCDGVEIFGTPIGGTFTLSYRHGRSDPIPHNATAEEIDAAGELVALRDKLITAEHDRDPESYADCKVCNPPEYVPPAPPSRWQMLKFRVMRAWYAWRGDY